MHLFKNCDRFVNLGKELHLIPSCIFLGPRICDAACIFHHITMLIMDDQLPILLLYEI
jgi:hypothetical protein